MRRKNQTFFKALRHASHGLAVGFREEANIRRQVLLLLLVILLGVYFNITPFQWVVIVVLAVFVLTLELVNSAIEALADAFHPDYSEHIERAKDLSAAAVLSATIAASILGLFIFAPPLLALVW